MAVRTRQEESRLIASFVLHQDLDAVASSTMPNNKAPMPTTCSAENTYINKAFSSTRGARDD